MIARVWRRHGLQPQRLERYMTSDDPDFEKKAADIIGLYLNPPQHAAVFGVDEKTAIQALDRLDPVLPLSPPRGSPSRLARCASEPASTDNSCAAHHSQCPSSYFESLHRYI